MPYMLRNRDLNAPKPDLSLLEAAVPTKRKTAHNDEDAPTKRTRNDENGPTRPKRTAVDGKIPANTRKATFTEPNKPSDVAKPSKRALPIRDQKHSDTSEVDPAPGYDFDKERAKDPFAVSEFASDIVKYYKHRESLFRVHEYFADQTNFTRQHRAASIDWLVQAQESFEVQHETLYLAVKIMDLFVCKSPPQSIVKSVLSLIPCTAFFLAAKFEERWPPAVDDLLKFCKTSYTPSQLLTMERQMLRLIGFDIGAPLSYSFLRRYGRVIKAQMHVLTAARYYLEVSLHYLRFSAMSESKLAMACMLLALRVTKTGDWSAILEKYSGYKLADVEQLMFQVNHMVCCFPLEHKTLKTVRHKYSDSAFYEVAKLPMLTDTLKGAVEG